jgi:regulator of sirC expression with transglutaminase-like and TPR domain
VLRPVGKRHILLRMLNNMRSIYLRRREYAKACEILNLLILADPASPKEYVQRGIVNMELKRLDAAKADFETYLRLSPGSRDRDVVRRQIRALETKLASYR